MIENRDVLESILFNFNEDFAKDIELSKSIKESDLKIEKLINDVRKELNNEESETLEFLYDEITSVVTSTQEMAYIRGVQEGVKLLHLLLSGNAVNRVMEIMGDKTTKGEITLFKANMGLWKIINKCILK